MTQPRRFDRIGMLALDPQAFLSVVIEPVDSVPFETTADGSTAIVPIRGPLIHHDEKWCESYERVLRNVSAAIDSEARTVLLKIDSPGGDVLGCFDTARTIRARAQAAGKKVVAYVDGCACSAGYALACAAESITISETGFAGSIGVLISRVDATAADAQFGLRYALIASGARKLDGNAHAALSDAELATMQAQCDALASLFFELVASLRGVDASAIAALEAGIFHGHTAVEAGLADAVSSFDEMLAALAGGKLTMSEDSKTEEPTAESGGDDTEPKASKEVDDARALLEKAAEGDDDDAEKARRALKALDGPGDDDDEDEGGESASSSAASSATARSGSGRRISAEMAGGLAEIVARQGAELEQVKRKLEKSELSTLLASRPDLDKSLVAYLKTRPYAEAKSLVDAIRKPAVPKPAATANVPGTRGAGQGDAPTVPASNPMTAAMDRAFGKGNGTGGVKHEGTSMIFGVRPPRSHADKPAASGDAGKGTA